MSGKGKVNYPVNVQSSALSQDETSRQTTSIGTEEIGGPGDETDSDQISEHEEDGDEKIVEAEETSEEEVEEVDTQTEDESSGDEDEPMDQVMDNYWTMQSFESIALTHCMMGDLTGWFIYHNMSVCMAKEVIKGQQAREVQILDLLREIKDTLGNKRSERVEEIRTRVAEIEREVNGWR